MTHYFKTPDSFRTVNCKQVAGERARKKCREWNSLIKKRNKLKREGKLEEAKEVEKELIEF
ncbi:MAG: hypothetical protein QNJ54_27635 [Prochloraceae cyanobacterium]|nr:hypothetical protein [Prochloraceae cyanobacterium]